MNRVFEFVILMSLAQSMSVKATLLNIAAEAWPPFVYEDRQSQSIVGIEVDITREVLRRIGVTDVSYKVFEWKRAWKMTEEGDADMVLTTSFNDKRAPFVHYPTQHGWESETIFFAAGKSLPPDFSGYASIKSDPKMKIGIIRGNSYDPSFWMEFPFQDGTKTFKGDLDGKKEDFNERLVLNGNMEEVFRRLDDDRGFHFTIADKTVGLFTIKAFALKNVTFNDHIVLYRKKYFSPFSRLSHYKDDRYPNIAALANAFDAELTEFKKSPAYADIFKRWIDPSTK